ncbi:hypothetical protein B0T26DRAFT_738348 [Lasiosphaeria miniovina]|uniref:PRISE-like Rossmann-fold domain-containing protein n=1 Tax=Lasiosphaeria miniovina TaxID=1954250 RepID=A0AA40E8D2_9PEZI|nr:uncharacterized protein B0T26DRAFT_738348 [Lasiosphaeria miniovina]KAK0727776.1 hypothetical protein B0T26DRAFT_738348 [Lasiosphaeria miniovina]
MPSARLKADRTALVFGASGITGWAVLHESLHYPTTDSFFRLVLPDDDRLILASGVDLGAGVDAAAAGLSGIEGIKGVTDVFFAAYVQPPGTSDFVGHEILKQVNVGILETAVLAVEKVCPRLRFWSLQTGGKSYGFVHAREIGVPKVPCNESDPRIPQPFEDQVFYYAQFDALEKLSVGKPWRFWNADTDTWIGFVPGGKNAMNLAQGLGLFLKHSFPRLLASYDARHTEIGQKTLGRAQIFTSHLIGDSNGEVYNVGDSPLAAGLNWRDKWVAICQSFGLVGLGPEEIRAMGFSSSEYMTQHRSEWEGFGSKHGLIPGVIQHTSWEFIGVMLSMAVFDRQHNLSKFAKAGFQERVDILRNYEEAFDLMRSARIIPRRSLVVLA